MLAPLSHAGPLKPDVLDADDVAWFYNRPGVTSADMTSDLSACQTFGRSMFGSNQPDNGMSYGLVGAIMGEIAAAGPMVAYTDDCMIMKGYRRFTIANERLKTFAARLESLPAETQALYFGAESPPEGTMTRHWVNTYWLAAPGDDLFVGSQPTALPKAPDVPTYNRWGQPKSIKPTPSGIRPVAGPGEAVVVMTVKAPMGTGAIIHFERRTSDGAADLRIDGKRKTFPGFEAIVPKAKSLTSEAVRFSFVVPEGIYALSMARTGRYDFTTFCLGTVALRIRAGEVVDLGDFAMIPAHQPVDPMAPAPLVQFRIDQPLTDEARASVLGFGGVALTRATYLNGFPRQCPLFARIYGFHLPGAASWTPQ